MNILFVAVGGAFGSVARYLVGTWVQSAGKNIGFPYGTLAVNLLGCFIIGLLSFYGDAHGGYSDEARAFIFIGVLGGFTTFSSFGNDTINLFRQDLVLNAFANIGANVIIGLIAVSVGRLVGQIIWR
jgi:CrcB protein